MNIKVIFSSGGKFNKNPDQQLADKDTYVAAKKISEALSNVGHSTELVKITPSQVNIVKKLETDVVFNLCEWSGKDYHLGVKVLKSLESKNTPYTGADSKSYDWCCNKVAMKKMFDTFKIPTPSWVEVNPSDNARTILQKIGALKYPLIVKPAYEHCAIGIDENSILKTQKDAIKKIKTLCASYNEPLLVEEFIYGREFNVTVFKNHRLHIFPPSEIVFPKVNKGFLFFSNKWSEKSDYTVSIEQDKKIINKLKAISRRAFLRMGCKGYVRIDFRVAGDRFYILEVNVNPSIDPHPEYALTASTEAKGWSFERLVHEITTSAIDNFQLAQN